MIPLFECNKLNQEGGRFCCIAEFADLSNYTHDGFSETQTTAMLTNVDDTL
jgi:hypothetical protein